jgi:hypothetical protein
MTFTTILGALVLAERRQIAFVKNSRTVSRANGFDSSSVVDSISDYSSRLHRPNHRGWAILRLYNFLGSWEKARPLGSKVKPWPA